MVTKISIAFCIIIMMQLQFASLLRPIKLGPNASTSRKVPIQAPDTDTFWKVLIDNLTEKILGMEHEIELIHHVFNESGWKETMIYNLKHKIGVMEKEMKKINDIVKDELCGNKQLIDNLNHKIGVVEKEMERIRDVVNDEVDGSKQIIDNLTKKNYIIEKEMESILIQQSGWQKLIENLTQKITEMDKKLIQQSAWQKLIENLTNKLTELEKNELQDFNWLKLMIENLTEKMTEIEKEQGVLKEPTNYYSFIGQGVTDFKTPKRITYQVAKLNGNGAFNAESGMFVAPEKGIYYFAFNKDLAEVSLSYDYTDYSMFPISMQVTAQLEKGDRAGVFLVKGHLANHATCDTTFTGFLIQKLKK